MILQKTNPSVKIPRCVTKLLPQLVWNIPNNENKVFLTFDDGPIPVVTEWVLDVLKEFNAKATFFCVGDNIRKHPDIFDKVLADGHSVGSHTFNHLNGWKTDSQTYLKNIKRAERYIQTDLFRPPHGRLRWSALSKLKQNYKVVMWDVLSLDYDSTLDGNIIYKNVRDNVESGSIIVFHDSIKSFNNIKVALPKTLEFLLNQGYVLDKIDMSVSSSSIPVEQARVAI